jgi:hypothetical protein
MINPNPVQTNQDFSTVEKLFLPGRPLSCQVTGTFIFAEPAGPDSVVVFGGYKLVFSCQRETGRPTPLYETVVLERTFCENIPVQSAKEETGSISVQFSQPLRAEAKPLSRWSTYVEVAVKGEISVQTSASPPAKDSPLESPEPVHQDEPLPEIPENDMIPVTPESSPDKLTSEILAQSTVYLPPSSNTQPPLAQIPSRPGLAASLANTAPPPKPPGIKT